MSQHIEPAYSQQEALERGLKYFFTGKECRNGHLSVRQASNNTCLKCKHEHQRTYQLRHPEKANSHSRKYRAKNVEVVRAKDKVKYYQKQLDKALSNLSDLTN